MTTEPFFDEEQTAVLEFMAGLTEQSAKMTADLTNSLMDSYQEDARVARAELKAVRMQIQNLFSGGYMPTETSIINALYPSPELVKEILESE